MSLLRLLPRGMATAAFAVLIGRVVGAGFVFLIWSVLLPRILDEREFGQFIGVAAKIFLVALVAMLGQQEAVVRFVSKALALHGPAAGERASKSSLAWVGAGLLFALVPTAWLIAGDVPEIRWYLLWFVLAAGGIAIQSVLGETLRGYHRLGMASLVSGGTMGGPLSNFLFAGACCVPLLLKIQADIDRVMIAYVVAIWIPIPVSLAMLWYVWKQPEDPESRAEQRHSDVSEKESTASDILWVGVLLMLTQLLAYWLAQGDILIADWLWPKDSAEASSKAAYFAARRLVLFAAMPSQIMSMSIMARISDQNARRQTRELQHSLQSAALAAAVVATPFLIVLLSFSGLILALVYGRESYREGALALQILCVGHLGLIAFGNPLPALAMGGHAREALIINLLSALVLAVLGPCSAMYFGTNGLAIVASGSFLLQNFLGWILVKRQMAVWSHPALSLGDSKSNVSLPGP
jgi:O-antigen/teichoic acid export membrane protein